MLTQDEGKAAVRLARDSLASYLSRRARISPSDLPEIFDEKRGVFVTLHEEGELRGCIGYPEPVLPLGKAIVDSAINAGVNDPRFPPVKPSELARIEIEVTVLTKPEPYEIPKKRLPEAVKIGRDGLIIRKGMFSGLLLPQVATEWNFDPLEFLGQVSVKAGLPSDAWLDDDAEISHFQAQIFSEVAPGREVVERNISDTSCSN